MRNYLKNVRKWKRILTFGMLLTMLFGLCACSALEETEGGLSDTLSNLITPSSPNESIDSQQKQTVYLPESYKYYDEDKHGNEYLAEKYYTYDAQGRMTSYTEKNTYLDKENLKEPDIPYDSVYTVTFTYDRDGNLESERWHSILNYHNGEVSEGTSLYTYTYTYDADGRVVRCATTRVSSDGETTNENDYTFTYDARGNLILATSQTDDYGWQYYEYDAQNRLVKETTCRITYEFPTPWEKVLYYFYEQAAYTYDAKGNVTEAKHLTAKSYEDVGYTGLENLEFQEGEYSAGYTFYYDKQGRLTGCNEPGAYVYDTNGHLVLEEEYGEITQRGKWITVLFARYTRDEHGNVTSFENYTCREEYTYVTRELNTEEKYSALRALRRGTQFTTSHTLGAHSFFNLYPMFHFLSTSSYEDYYHLIPNPIW